MVIGSLFTLPTQAAVAPAEQSTQSFGQATSVLDSQTPSQSSYEKLKQILGITYFSYFFGPGVHPDNALYNPNQLGLPGNDGMYFQNQASFRYKFSNNLALDFQTRFNLILNNSTQNQNFSLLRWEAPRLGVSGTLLSGADWTLSGAINTDFPYFFPAPFTGYKSQQRQAYFTPGMFTSLKYEPRNSPWSLFSVISPRFFFYADKNAAEPQMVNSGLIPQNKPDLIIALQPTINYRISPKTKMTLGSTIDYRKHVISNWNPLNASLITNGDSTAWRLDAVPLNLGVTFNISSSFNIFPFVTTYPIAIQRVDAKTGVQSTLLETTSVGMWLYGTIF